MVDTQIQTYVTDFTNQIQLESQQATSFFRGKVLEAPVKGKVFEHQNLGAYEVSEITSRFGMRELTNPNHSRRGAIIKSFEEVVGVADIDQLRAICDITSGNSKSLAQAMMRRLDLEVATAALGSVLTGEQFTTTTTASTDGVQTVTAASGLTYDVLRDCQQKLYSKGVGLNGEKLYLAMTDVQMSTLMDQIEVISSDYNKKQAAETGVLPSVLGFNFIVFPSSPTTGDSIIAKPSTRSCFAFAADGIKLGMLSDIKVDYQPRHDLQGGVNQLVVSASFAALRTQGSKVVQINVTEA